MKKKIIILSLAIVLITSCVISKSVGKRGESTDVQIPDVSGESVTPAFGETHENETVTTKDCYTVREYNEKIGIFKNEETEPFATLDIYTFMLPEKDRELLKAGFVIDGDKLYGIIEDYTG